MSKHGQLYNEWLTHNTMDRYMSDHKDRMEHNTEVEEKLAGKVVICDGLYTGKSGTILGIGSSRHSVKLLIDGVERYEPDYALLHVTEDTEQAIKLLLSHHHQLQKARHDWLREEIVRLEGMKDKFGVKEGNTHCDVETCEVCQWNIGAYEGNNHALQTIIDRYLAELNQDNK